MVIKIHMGVWCWTTLIFASAISLLASGMLSAAECDQQRWKKHTVVDQTLGQVSSVLANDWGQDGSMDLISSHGGGVHLYRGDQWVAKCILQFADVRVAERKLRPSCIHSCLLDVDGDGDMDFIGSNSCVFLLLCPDKPFEQEWEFSVIDAELSGTHCVVTGDLNGDGRPELVANSGRAKGTNFPNSICFYEIPVSEEISQPWSRSVFAENDAPGGSHYMGVGDIDGDGKIDISAAAKGGARHPGGEWFAWWQQGEDRYKPWTKHELSAAEPGATHLEPHDLNGDEVMDLVGTRGHGEGVLWFKGPAMDKREIDPLMVKPHTLDVADIDRDGDLDFSACGREIDGEVVWYENNGKGDFKKHPILSNQSAYDLHLVDMDGDSDLDILIAGQFSRNIIWLENLQD